MKLSYYQKIPFYGNTPDNTHCNQAVIKMMLGYYFPKKHYDWAQLDAMTGKREGLWTWPMKGWLTLSQRGLNVTYYGTFDYRQFIAKGGEYLLEKYGSEVGQAQIDHSDIPYEVEITKDLLTQINQVKLVPDLEHIEQFIVQDSLILCNVNYFPLYDRPGYAGHLVLIYGIDENFVYLHDPGLPPNPHAQIPIDRFLRAWNYSGAENKGLTVIVKGLQNFND